MNKQLKIWKDDFLRYYGRTSILARVAIGAILSFAIAYLIIEKIIKPQNAELKSLKQKFDAMEIIDDVDIQVADLKNKQRKINMQLEGLTEANQELAGKIGNLSKGEIGKSIIDLRFLIDNNNLRIISEERIVKANQAKRRKAQKQPIDTQVKITFPASMTFESHQFQVLGSYRDIQNFLNEVRKSQALFFLNNVTIGQSKEMLVDKDLNEYPALACHFQVHVPYQQNTKTTGEKP